MLRGIQRGRCGPRGVVLERVSTGSGQPVVARLAIAGGRHRARWIKHPISDVSGCGRVRRSGRHRAAGRGQLRLAGHWRLETSVPGRSRCALRRWRHRGSRRWHVRRRQRVHLRRCCRRQRGARGRCGLLRGLPRRNHRRRNQRRSSRRRTQERGKGAARWRSLGHRQACSGKTPLFNHAHVHRRTCADGDAIEPQRACLQVFVRPTWSWLRLRRCRRKARSACLLR